MAIVQRQPVTGVCGRASSGVDSIAEPLVRGQSHLKLKTFKLLDVQRKKQVCLILLISQTNEPSSKRDQSSYPSPHIQITPPPPTYTFSETSGTTSGKSGMDTSTPVHPVAIVMPPTTIFWHYWTSSAKYLGTWLTTGYDEDASVLLQDCRWVSE